MGGILDQPIYLSAPLIIGGTVLISVVTHAIAHRMLSSRTVPETKELGNSIAVRVSALHALILALIFAQELINLNKIHQAASKEAELVGDVFYDLKRFDVEETVDVRRSLAAYVADILDKEWTTLATDKSLAGEAWEHWETVYQAVLELEPETARQKDLRRIMLQDIRAVSALRRDRENAAFGGAHPLFLIAALIGLVVTMACYFTHPPTVVNVLLISLFGAYTGLVVFFIVAFANPYREPGAVEPVGFERLFTGEMSALHRGN